MHGQCLHRHPHTKWTPDSLNDADRPPLGNPCSAYHGTTRWACDGQASRAAVPIAPTCITIVVWTTVRITCQHPRPFAGPIACIAVTICLPCSRTMPG